VDEHLARSALGIDLDQVGITHLRQLVDRALAIGVRTDARDQTCPAACLTEVPRDVGRRSAQTMSVREPVPQHFSPDHNSLVATN
jgi:hypothetical protein